MHAFHRFGSAAQFPCAAARRRLRRVGRGRRAPKYSEATPKRFGPCGPQGAGTSPCVRTGSGRQTVPPPVTCRVPESVARPALLRSAPKLLRSRPGHHRAERRGGGGQAPRSRAGAGLASGEVRQGPTEVRQGLSGHPSGARRRAKYRQVSPGAARAARPRGGGKTFAGRGHGPRGAAAPSQVSPSIARVPHLEDGTTAAPGRPLSSGSSHARSGAAGAVAPGGTGRFCLLTMFSSY